MRTRTILISNLLPRPYQTVAALLSVLIVSQSVLATCGGGGGGGFGGAAGGEPEVYKVAWKLLAASQDLPKLHEDALLVLWFPPSPEEFKKSKLHSARGLALGGSRCVMDVVVDPRNREMYQKYNLKAGQEAVVLISGDGTELNRVMPDKKGRMSSFAADKLLKSELDKRQKSLATVLKAAEEKAKKKDLSAEEELQKIWVFRCYYPNLGKRAAKALKRIGIKVGQAELESLGPDYSADPDVNGEKADVEEILKAGLEAELARDYEKAGGFYRRAVNADPADPTALRFLGEFHRHHSGDWDEARRLFTRILNQPSDSVARAVALHGLGKMTIHAGDHKKGLKMFEESLEAFPLPITYRNLAVYWFSELEHEIALGYVDKAIELEPEDPYNQIFAAVYLAVAGKTEEALQIAKNHQHLLDASYNLAALYAQIGDTRKAMEMLRRHFYEYEKYDAVRAKEMKEAREDYMFAVLQPTPEFIELTALAAPSEVMPMWLK